MSKQLLSATQWKVLLIAIAVMSIALSITATLSWKRSADPEMAGTLAATFGTPDRDYRRPVLRLLEDSPLAKAGVVIGDKVFFDNDSDYKRALGTDEVVGLTLYSKETARHLTVRPMPGLIKQSNRVGAAAAFFTQAAVVCFSVIIAVAIGLQRPDSLAIRAFVLAILVDGPDYFSDLLPAGHWQDMLRLFVRPVLNTLYYPAFLYFTLSFPEDRPLFERRWLRRVFVFYCLLYLALALGVIADAAHALPWTIRQSFSVWDLRPRMAMVSVALSLAALFFSWRRSQGTTRQRLGWIALCMGALQMTYFVTNLNTALQWVPDSALDVPDSIVVAMGYGGLAYALLRHRLFDFGFAVNRALVFTIVSTLVLVAFSILEWGVDKLLHFQGREKNVIFDALAALIIILSFHRIQHWVAHKVDHTFFHRWYEAAEKLRHFLGRASHISDASVLLAKFTAAAVEFARASGAAIYQVDGNGALVSAHSTLANFPSTIDENNDAVVAMRHSHKVVDLIESGNALPGALAFPIIVRGRVKGLLLMGDKISGNHYRPDEILLLASAANQLGLDLESLRVEELERNVLRLKQDVVAHERVADQFRQIIVRGLQGVPAAD